MTSVYHPYVIIFLVIYNINKEPCKHNIYLSIYLSIYPLMFKSEVILSAGESLWSMIITVYLLKWLSSQESKKYINLLVLQPYYLQFSFSNYKQMYNIIEQSTCGYLTRDGGGRMPDGLKLTCTIILPLIQNDSF